MRNSTSVFLTIIAAASVGFMACPRLPSGYLFSVTADIVPQPIESIRSAVLDTGAFYGPIEIQGGSTLCIDQKYYRKVLPKSAVVVIAYDCYRAVKLSETGWAYSVTISVGPEGLRDEVKKEIEQATQQIQTAIQRVVPNAKVTIQVMETGYGFSLLPY